MSPRMFVGWWVAAIAAIVAAVIAVSGQPGLTTAETVNEPAFPDLRARPEAVARIEIATPDGRFALQRQGDAWVAVDRYGYPADTQLVHDLIGTLADMRLLEAKTTRPDRFARLEVEDADADDARSRHVRLLDADGAVLAEAYLGKRISRSHAYGSGGIYVRRGGDDRAWLASGSVDVAVSPTDWLAGEIIDIPRDQVRRVAAVPADDGGAYVTARPDPDADMVLEGDLPEGREADPSAVNRTASALVGIRLTDVRPAAEMPLPDRRSFVTVTTFDGVEVLAEMAMIDDQPWARFTARPVAQPVPAAPDEAAAPDQDAPTQATAEPAEPPVDGIDTPAEAEGAAPAEDAAAAPDDGDAPAEDQAAAAADAARTQAEAINARLDGWVFRLQDSVAERLDRGLDDLLAGDGTS